MSEEKRIGLLGGSFDPIHLGHLMVAQDAIEGMALDQVILMPAARSPLKPRNPKASDEDRLAMLVAAIEGDVRFELSTLELERGGMSYSIDTVEQLALGSKDRLFWILGADQAACLNAWHRIDDLVQKVEFVVLARPGFSWDSGLLPRTARVHTLESHLVSVSSSEIRERVRARKSIRFMVTEGVATVIEKRHLYG